VSLSRRLLGRTWLVDRLSTALRIAQTSGRGLEFVTSDGELLTSDGTLIVGPRQAATGMLSRRSELRDCHNTPNMSPEKRPVSLLLKDVRSPSLHVEGSHISSFDQSVTTRRTPSHGSPSPLHIHGIPQFLTPRLTIIGTNRLLPPLIMHATCRLMPWGDYTTTPLMTTKKF
jgi:hypothetical protein